jgi:hypothetical protein
MTLLFDAPAWLLVLLAVVGLALLLSGLRRQQDKLGRAGVALLAVAALLFILRLLVPTAEKKVEKQSRDLMDAIGRNDWPTVSRLVRNARFADWEGWDGEQIAKNGQQAAERYGLVGLKINSLETRREPNVISVTVSVTTSHKGIFVDTVPSTWLLEYQQRPQGWVLTRIVPVKIGWGPNSVTPEDALKHVVH